MDASLKELAGLVKQVNPEARKRGTCFEFAVVYPDLRTSSYRSRDIGNVRAGKKGPDDNTTLAECKFTIGDYVDIAVIPPNGRIDGGDEKNGERRRVGGVLDRLDGRNVDHRKGGGVLDRLDGKNVERRQGGGVLDRLGERPI